MANRIVLTLLLSVAFVSLVAGQIAVGGDFGVGGGIATQATQARGYVSPGFTQNFNNAVVPLPGFARSVLGNERVIVDTAYTDGSRSEFGAITENGVITNYQETPYESSTVKVYVSEATINRIAKSTNPMAELKRAWGTEIRFEGLNLLTQLKYGFANIILSIYFIFVPSVTTEEETPIPAITSEEEFEFIDCQGGAGLVPGKEVITGDDRDRFTDIVDNMTLLGQPNGHTCTPTSGAMDLVHWNSTIAPGLVNMTSDQLIADLAKRMNTTTTGTKDNAIAVAIAQYISDHGYGSNFTVKYYYKRPLDPVKNVTVGNTLVQYKPKAYDVDYYDVRDEVRSGENLIVSVSFTGTKNGHTMKLVALNTTKDDNGEFLVAFADPETRSVVIGSLTRDGNLDIYGRKPMKVASIVSISPTNKAKK